MREVRITGLGTYLPEKSVDNETVPAFEPTLTSADVERVGVRRRGVAGEHEDVTTMAVRAAEAALRRAETSAAELDFLILANWTERRYVPDFAPRVQERLGARHAFAFDVCGACTGFVYGLSLAHGQLQSPRLRRGLVVASDRSSRLVRPGSRASLLFGDGAGAAVVEAERASGWRLRDIELKSDGSKHGIMDVGADGFLSTHVKQRELNELAVASLIAAGKSLLARHGLTFRDVDYIVPHSGTAGIQAMLAQALDLPPARILTNLPEVGNLTTASIPVALRDFVDRGTLRPGQRVLCVAVGLGWQFVAGLLEL